MRAVFTLTFYGVIQLVRARIFVLFIAAGAVLAVFALLLDDIAAGRPGRALLDIGLAANGLVMSVLAAALPIVVVSQELETRSAQLLLARPVSRTSYVVGRFLAVVVCVGFAAAGLSTLLALLVANKGTAPFTEVLAAGLFSALGPVLVAAISTAAAVALRTVTAATVVALFFFLGRLAPELVQLGEKPGLQGAVLGRLAWVVPDLGRFRWFELSAVGDSAPAALIYCLFYVSFLITAATLFFSKRDLS